MKKTTKKGTQKKKSAKVRKLKPVPKTQPPKPSAEKIEALVTGTGERFAVGYMCPDGYLPTPGIVRQITRSKMNWRWIVLCEINALEADADPEARLIYVHSTEACEIVDVEVIKLEQDKK